MLQRILGNSYSQETKKKIWGEQQNFLCNAQVDTFFIASTGRKNTPKPIPIWQFHWRQIFRVRPSEIKDMKTGS